MSNKKEIKEFIKNKMLKQIKCDLTIGRTDNDLKPYNTKKIQKFIEERDEDINNSVDEMYKTCKDDGDSNDDILKTADDGFREFLYEHIDNDDFFA